MKRLIAVSVIGLLALAVPISPRLLADDAHHPEKAAKAKKSTKAKAKQQKRPATKTDKTRQGEMHPSLPTLRVETWPCGVLVAPSKHERLVESGGRKETGESQQRRP